MTARLQDLPFDPAYGHEVGRSTAMRLRAAGLNARYLRGGIDGWQAAGRPLIDKPEEQTP
jgi:Fe-Mn family superoxide dismutase